MALSWFSSDEHQAMCLICLCIQNMHWNNNKIITRKKVENERSIYIFCWGHTKGNGGIWIENLNQKQQTEYCNFSQGIDLYLI